MLGVIYLGMAYFQAEEGGATMRGTTHADVGQAGFCETKIIHVALSCFCFVYLFVCLFVFMFEEELL